MTCSSGTIFLSTPSARRATCCRPPARGLSPISIHALREEGDPQDHDHNQRGRHFYPRPPRGGRQACIFTRTITSLFLSTPSARRATRDAGRSDPVRQISIHALREEGDASRETSHRKHRNFYPRPPRGGRRDAELYQKILFPISIHALREEGDVQAGTVLGASGPISIHALREEGDRRVVPLFGLTLYFYPRPPRGGRPPSQDRRGTTQNFYPRPPRGGRLGCRWALSRASRFLSTPSARRATRRRPRQRPVGRISIHALREEGDEPAAEAPAPTGISIHALREEGDAQ